MGVEIRFSGLSHEKYFELQEYLAGQHTQVRTDGAGSREVAYFEIMGGQINHGLPTNYDVLIRVVSFRQVGEERIEAIEGLAKFIADATVSG